MVVAAPNSAANPRLGVNSVIFVPTVFITRQPHVARPMAIATPPNARNHPDTGAFVPTTPSLMVSQAAAIGPMALATSFEPCANATKPALMTCR